MWEYFDWATTQWIGGFPTAGMAFRVAEAIAHQ